MPPCLHLNGCSILRRSTRGIFCHRIASASSSHCNNNSTSVASSPFPPTPPPPHFHYTIITGTTTTGTPYRRRHFSSTQKHHNISPQVSDIRPLVHINPPPTQTLSESLLQKSQMQKSTIAADSSKPEIRTLILSTDEKQQNILLESTSLSAQEFLKSFPRGPYTVCRTIQHMKYVFMFEEHVRRLLHSHGIMFPAAEEGQSPSHSHTEEKQQQRFLQIRSQILALMKDAVNHFAPEQKLQQDLKMTILLNEESNLYIHFAPYTDTVGQQRHYVCADIAPGTRKEMLAKDSIWVQEMRDRLLKLKHADSEEVIMCEADGTLREGVSSNVFAIRETSAPASPKPSYELLTAHEGIIKGTVRNLLLQEIEKGNILDDQGEPVDIQVAQEDVNIRELPNYKELFITSTSRLVMPFGKVYLHEEVRNFLPKETEPVVRFDEQCTYEESISRLLDRSVTTAMIASSHELNGANEVDDE